MNPHKIFLVPTTDHEQIRTWIQKHHGAPAKTRIWRRRGGAGPRFSGSISSVSGPARTSNILRGGSGSHCSTSTASLSAFP